MNPTHEKDFDTAPIEEVHQYLVENNISGSHLMRDIAKAVYRIRMDERGKCLALLDHDLSYRLAVRFFERNAALVESEGYGILYEDFERLTECGPEQFHEYRSRWIAGNRERAAHGHA